MLIDWFTVGAQVLNFGILVWLMQRFLYRPVLDAIDAREKRIAAELADAAAKAKQAGDDRDEFVRKNAAFDAQRAGLLVAATAAAAVERQRLLAAAARDAAADADKRHGAARAEVVALQHAFDVRARQEVFAVARQTLADLASASLEERICAVFLDRLRALDGTARAGLIAAIASATEPVWLRSAFVLADAQRATLERGIHESLATKATLRFETAPDLVAGIELRAGGQRLAWGISQHLDALEQSVEALVPKAGTAKATARAVALFPAAVPVDTVATTADPNTTGDPTTTTKTVAVPTNPADESPATARPVATPA